MALAFSLASKLSASSLFLLAPSPPKLPQIPTLAELQKRAVDIQGSLQQSLPSYSLTKPTSTTQPRRIDGPQPQQNEKESGWTEIDLRPQSYSSDEQTSTGGRGSGKLSKLRRPSRWRRIQDEIPGEVRVPKMEESSVYARSVYAGYARQPQIEDVRRSGGDRKWWKWLFCRR